MCFTTECIPSSSLALFPSSLNGNRWHPFPGRVLAVTGQADDFKEALRRAYEAVAKIRFDPPGAASGFLGSTNVVGWLFWREGFFFVKTFDSCLFFWGPSEKSLAGNLCRSYCYIFGSLPTCWWMEGSGSTPCGELKNIAPRAEFAGSNMHFRRDIGHKAKGSPEVCTRICLKTRYANWTVEGDKSFGRT